MTYPLFHPERRDDPLLVDEEHFRREVPAEGQHVEFKEGLGVGPIQDTVVAFSNADGGVLFLGIADDGAFTGRSLQEADLDQVHQAIQAVRNPGSFAVNHVQVGAHRVIVVRVARGREAVAQTPNGRVLARRGSSNVPVFGTELAALVAERRPGSYETDPTDTSLAAAGEERKGLVADSLGWQEWDPSQAAHQGLISGDRLTNMGALLLLDDPTVILPKARIEYLRFEGGDDRYSSRQEFTGPIDMQVIRATEHAVLQIGTEMVVVGVHRHDLQRIPPEVLREAIANAVAHRSYEFAATIRIEHRPTEVRVVSPGGLIPPVTVHNIRTAQASRNPGILRVLRGMRLAEDLGRGVDFMLDTMEAELLEPPHFSDEGHQVVVTLPLTGPVTPYERAWLKELEPYRAIQPEDRILVVAAARGELLTNSRARELLRTEDPAAARHSLQRLRDLGVLQQSGDRGATEYRLSSDTTPLGTLRLPDTAVAQLILDHATEGPITNSIVRSLTGLDRSDALRALQRLVDQGQLERRGTRRGTHYVLPGDA